MNCNSFRSSRHTFRGAVNYFIRPIPAIFVAGQTFPVQEVPRPQARKITQTLKNRMQVVAYRLMRQDKYHRLKFDRLRRAFPMFSEFQIRSKLKVNF